MIEDSENQVEYTGAKDSSASIKKDAEEKKKDRQGLPPTVEVEIASAPMQLKPKDPGAKGPWIQYNGVGTVRVMTPEDWASLGTEGPYCEWNYLNEKRLPRSIFTDEQLQYLLRQDGRFSLVEDEK